MVEKKRLRIEVIISKQHKLENNEHGNLTFLKIEIVLNNKNHFKNKIDEIDKKCINEIKDLLKISSTKRIVINMVLWESTFDHSVSLTDLYCISNKEDKLLEYFNYFIKEIKEYAEIFYENQNNGNK